MDITISHDKPSLSTISIDSIDHPLLHHSYRSTISVTAWSGPAFRDVPRATACHVTITDQLRQRQGIAARRHRCVGAASSHVREQTWQMDVSGHVLMIRVQC